MTEQQGINLLHSLGATIKRTPLPEINCLCPFPNHNDTTSSFSLNIDSLKWVCFKGCGEGHVLTLIRVLKKCSINDAKKYLLKFGISEKDLLFLQNTNEETYIPKYKGLLKQYIPKYWYQRGLTTEEWNKYAIFFHTEHQSIVFKVTNAIVERFILAESRYKVFNKKNGYFLINNDSEKLLIVEGIIDVIKANRIFPDMDIMSVLGNSVSEYQQKFINKNWKYITLGFDNDKTGQQAIYKQRHKFKNKIVYKLIYPKGLKDFGEITTTKYNFGFSLL